MSYIHTGLTTRPHHPTVDKGSLPATYRGERVPRSRYYGKLKFSSERFAEFVGGKKYRGRVMVKYLRKRRKNRRRGKIRKNIPSAPFPSKVIRKLKTVQYIDAGASTSGALKHVEWVVNDLADPEGAYGTQQALGFDQYSTLYKRYCVLGAKITVMAHNKDGSNAWIVGTHLNTENTGAITTYEHLKELKNTQVKLLSPDVDHITWVHKCSVPKLFKTKKLLANDDEYGGTLVNHASGLTSPTRKAYLEIFAQPMDQSTTTSAGCQFVITMEQIVLFYDYDIPSRSVV